MSKGTGEADGRQKGRPDARRCECGDFDHREPGDGDTANALCRWYSTATEEEVLHVAIALALGNPCAFAKAANEARIAAQEWREEVEKAREGLGRGEAAHGEAPQHAAQASLRLDELES